MNKQEEVKIMYLINLIESDIRSHERLLEDYEKKAKDSIYYFGLEREKRDRIKSLEKYLQCLKDM